MMKRLLSEPLAHFLAAAAVIFAAYSWINPSDPSSETNRVVVSAPKVEQLAGLFAMTWQRPPTQEELKGLIDDYVKEEILVREAIALGVDKNDAVVRRRLRTKMEFLADFGREAAAPTDAELVEYLKRNPERFRIEPMTSFQHVYLSPQKRGAGIADDADIIYRNLTSNRDLDPSKLGDPTLLPSEVPLASLRTIGQVFGEAFAKDLQNLKVGDWSEPLPSSFGVHIVRVNKRVEGRVPELHEAREAVAREWSNERRQALERERFETLLRKYTIAIEAPEKGSAR